MFKLDLPVYATLALVYPIGADCRIRQGTDEQCLGLSLPDCSVSYLDEYGVRLRHLLRLGMLRFRERILEEGQRLYVLGSAFLRGHAVSISEPDAVTGTDGVPAANRVAALTEEAVAVVRQGEHESTFIISQESEREVASGLGARAFGEPVGGPLLTALVLGYWLVALSSRRSLH